MKKRIQLILAAILFATFNLQLSTARAQGTAFTYQGRLNDGGNPANGIYDLRFTIYDALANGNVVGNSLTNFDTGVTNGLFTVPLDFGNVFEGGERWLDIAVSTNGANNFTALSPRQPITPTPYAIFANSASNLMGAIPVTQFSGIISPVNLPNGLGGDQNTASGYNATVSGGYNNTASGTYYATVGGGGNNQATNSYATVPGGYGNIAGGVVATVGGGFANTASGDYATVSGGLVNTASGAAATVGGGAYNQATNSYATVPGGINNIAGGANSFAAGNRAKAVNTGAFVWADSQNAYFSSTNNDSFNVRAQGGARFVTGGTGMSIDGQPVLTSGNGGTISQSVLGATNSYVPTIGDGTHNFTTSTAQGYYTEIGNMVFVQIWIVWTDKGSSGDVVQISLPFSVPPTLQQRAIFSFGYVQGITFSHQLITTASPGWTSLELFDLAPGAAPNYISVSNFASNGEIQLSGFFRRQ